MTNEVLIVFNTHSKRLNSNARGYDVTHNKIPM